MADIFSLSGLFSSGGTTIIILGICSIVSIVIIIERMIYFSARNVDADQLLQKIIDGEPLSKKEKNSIEGYVLSECVLYKDQIHRVDDPMFEEVKSRSIAECIREMERYLNIEATLGTVSPYIGLLGTVFGIIQAFSSLGSDGAGMNGLNAGIAHALVATAGGLLVAIPATMAYNYFKKRVQQTVLTTEILSSKLKVALVQNKQS